jgi:2-amino-4-hydroxy-6-hydroxymethyldihydropteridine diphosphokinase
MQVYIGLGSNLADPEMQVRSALNELKNIADTELLQSSSLYKSPPMGPQDQPDYINAVALCETELAPLDFLAALQAIEQQHGRVRNRHWGERTLDLDLLVYGQEIVELPGLTIPHPGIAERAFVLYPMAEIAPNIIVPKFGAISELVANCPLDGLQRIEAED